jgi:hypothetical protein
MGNWDMTANTTDDGLSADIVRLMDKPEAFDRAQVRIIECAHAIVDDASAELTPESVAAIEANVGRILVALGAIKSAITGAAHPNGGTP